MECFKLEPKKRQTMILTDMYGDFVRNAQNQNNSYDTVFSPPVLMHGGLLCVAFHLSVCLSVCL